MIVLDTTVLVYAVGGEHPLRAPCRRLMTAASDGRISATTTVEVIEEFTHIRARRYGRADAADLGDDFVALLAPLLRVTEPDLGEGLNLYRRHERLGAFEAVLAATAIAGAAAALVSADRAFSDIPRLHHVAPDDDGVADLLAQPR